MNKKTQSGFIAQLIIGIVAVLIIAGAYLAYKNENGQGEESDQASGQFLASTTTTSTMSSTTTINNVRTNATGGSTSTQPSIVVSSPKSGDVFAEGSTHIISWQTKGFSSPQIQITLVDPQGNCVFCTTVSSPSVHGGTYYAPLIVPNTGSYSWTVPSPNQATPSTQSYKLLLEAYPHTGSQMAEGPFGYSDVFQIQAVDNPSSTSSTQPSITVISPNGGETLIEGTTKNITWKNTNAALNQTGDIKLEFQVPACAEPGQAVRCMIGVSAPLTIKHGVSLNYGLFTWNVGQVLNDLQSDMQSIEIVPAGRYKIQICPTNFSSSTQCDESDNYFTITN